MPDVFYYSMCRKMRNSVKDDTSRWDVIWTIADATACLTDKLTPSIFGGIGDSSLQTLQTLYNMAVARKSDVVPNPYFVAFGFADEESPATQKYLRERASLGIASNLMSIGSTLAALTHVDIAAATRHGNATASTVAHLKQFESMAKSCRRSETLSGWIKTVITMKTLKVTVRGTQLAGAIIGGFAGTIITSIITSVMKLGINVSHTNTCYVLAMELHWRARQEANLLKGAKGASGPAGRIIAELFKRRGLTRIYGQHDVARIIHEPGGWRAIGDKLVLM
jgi:hypothetical protein